MVHPLIIAAAVSAIAKGVGAGIKAQQQKKASKRKAKEMKRETMADLMNQALQNRAELEGINLDTSKRMGGAQSRNLLNTASTVRESFR